MNTNEIEKLRAREAQIKKRIREIQSRAKSTDRRERTARLIRWGIVVEGMLKTGKIEAPDWIDACKFHLNARDFEVAVEHIRPSHSCDAHLPVPASPEQCAPAAGENRGG